MKHISQLGTVSSTKHQSQPHAQMLKACCYERSDKMADFATNAEPIFP